LAGPAPLLELSGLRTAFATPRGLLQAVDGVDLAIAPGETLAVVGESGSGKSVTALSILRLFTRGDHAQLQGSITWRRRDGGTLDLATLDERALRDVRGREIAVIFQDPSASLNPVLSIGNQIREALRRHRPREDAQRVAVDLLRDVGIADPEGRIEAYPHQLSGGMRQRVMIAIALACAPRLLIADEPTTALDVTIQAQIMRLLADLKRKHGMALLFITHDLALVGRSRIAWWSCTRARWSRPAWSATCCARRCIPTRAHCWSAGRCAATATAAPMSACCDRSPARRRALPRFPGDAVSRRAAPWRSRRAGKPR
jgi:peptide/nickel transport system ATP-binding protein